MKYRVIIRNKEVLANIWVNAKDIREAINKAVIKGKIKETKGLRASVWRHPHILMGHGYPIQYS